MSRPARLRAAIGVTLPDRVSPHQRAVVARHVQRPGVIDIHAVRAAGGKGQCCTSLRSGKARDEHHGRVADCEKHPRVVGIHHAPARPAGKLERRAPPGRQFERLQFRRVGVVADAGRDADFAEDVIATPFGRGAVGNTARVCSVAASSQARLAAPRLVTSTLPLCATIPAASGKPSAWRCAGSCRGR